MIYKLDGSESKNEQMGRGGAQTLMSKAKWDGLSLVIDTTREIQGMPITTHEVRKLDNGGKEMNVESTTQTPQGEIKRNVVYTKSLTALRRIFVGGCAERTRRSIIRRGVFLRRWIGAYRRTSPDDPFSCPVFD